MNIIKIILPILLILLPKGVTALTDHKSIFLSEEVKVADDRMAIDLNDFKISHAFNNPIVQVNFVKDSIQWIRTENNLLLPRVRLTIIIKDPSPKFHFSYLENKIIPQHKEDYLFGEIYLDILSPDSIEIYEGEKLIEKIEITPQSIKGRKQKILVDYSCSRYGIEVSGIDDAYISIGCHMGRLRDWRKHKPRLGLKIAISGYYSGQKKEKDNFFRAYIHQSSSTKLELFNHQGEKKTLSIKAKVPERLRRLQLAWGFGPYPFKSEQGKLKQNRIAAAFFLYGKLKLVDDELTSLKFFNGLIFNKAFFNNAGLYFSYEITNAFDNRISFTALLGGQLLTYQFDKTFTSQTDFIFPQGFEAQYRHAFGIKNYSITYGMFIPTSNQDNYNNIWLRWGKNYFWELNYISWHNQNRRSTTYGLSIGFPLKSFF